MLTLSHVSKSYGKFPAVEDISLDRIRDASGKFPTYLSVR